MSTLSAIVSFNLSPRVVSTENYDSGAVDHAKLDRPNAGPQLLPEAAALAQAVGSQLHAVVRRRTGLMPRAPASG